MSTFQRPAPDIAKIVAAWETWIAGGEDVLPGRTMADLKIGGTDKVLETLAGETESVQPVFDAWMTWEKGRMMPEDALAAMTESGFADLVEALAVDA